MNEIQTTFIPFHLANNLKNAFATLFPNGKISLINNEHGFRLTCEITPEAIIGIVSCIEGYFQSMVKLNTVIVINEKAFRDPWVAIKECINTGFSFYAESVCNLHSMLE